MESFGPIIALLGLFGLAILVCFFAFQPKWVNKKQLSAFNWSVLFIVAMLCFAWHLNMERLFIGELEKYRAPFLWLGIFTIQSVLLLVFLLLRNFWIFKGKKLGAR